MSKLTISFIVLGFFLYEYKKYQIKQNNIEKLQLLLGYMMNEKKELINTINNLSNDNTVEEYKKMLSKKNREIIDIEKELKLL